MHSWEQQASSLPMFCSMSPQYSGLFSKFLLRAYCVLGPRGTAESRQT